MSLSHLYVSPLSRCNLNCKMCYTFKNQQQLSRQQVLSFVKCYQDYLAESADFKSKTEVELEVVTLCGGEIFLDEQYLGLINQLTDLGLLVQVITNGTIDKLDLIKQPNQVNLIVSLDGPQKHHQANRGVANWQKTINFLRKALSLGFHCQIFCVVSQGNFEQLDLFEENLVELLGQALPITYHPRKSKNYLKIHPLDNLGLNAEAKGDAQFAFLTDSQIKKLCQTRDTFPPKNLGCSQLSIFADGNVYACCEGTKAIGKLQDPIEDLVQAYCLAARQTICAKSVKSGKGGKKCAYPEFVCGLREVLSSI